MRLSPEEYQRICAALGRRPNALELGLFELNWSEHCSYKSSRRLLKLLPTTGKHVVAGPGENAGVIELQNTWCVAFKVESHNHPSAVEPFHGAATGVGGIIRDILSMGARPMALLDSLRFGEGAHARRLLSGVVAGISHYGNCVGVPTVGGDVSFDEAYAENCLVNVMCVGLLKKSELKRAQAGGVGNTMLLVGARTGRDGIHGATFASQDLIGETEAKRPNVQVGDPFTAKSLIEATLEVCQFPELIGLQDLGAGGLATAPAEMAARGGVGIALDLEEIPLRDPTMTPYEILLSESQERMVLCVQAGSAQKFVQVYRKWGLEAAVIGEVIAERVYRIRHEGRTIAEVPIELLVGGAPEPELPGPGAESSARFHLLSRRRVSPVPLARGSWSDRLKELLRSPTIASKRWIFEQYDHTVQTNTVVGPGSHDAAVLRVKGERFGIAVTIGGNGRFCQIDPYEGGVRAVCEAVHNLISVGARPLGITDCLNFANPTDPQVFWSFEQTIRGMAKAAGALELPFISGNVSFYNQSAERQIYPTPIVGMVGLVEDLGKLVPMGFQSEGDLIYLIGQLEGGHVGGSEFMKVFYKTWWGDLDRTDIELERRLLRAMLALTDRQILASAHDVSEGGVLGAVAEKGFARGLGARLELEDSSEEFLFGEWPSRLVITVAPECEAPLRKTLEEFGVPYRRVGVVSGDSLEFCGERVSIAELYRIYESALPESVL